MKTKLFSLLLLWVFACQFVLAQTETDKKIRVSDISVQFGQISLPYQRISLADLQKIAPQSEILKKDFSGFTQRGGSGSNTREIVSMLLGLEFGKKEQKGHPELRIGFNYFRSKELDFSLYKQERKVCDTLISTQTGQMYFLDSVYAQSCSASSSSEQLRLDVSYIYQTNPKARFSGFMGIGATAGAALNSATSISYYDYKYKTSFGSSSSYSFSPINSPSERIENKNNMAFSAYIPLGCDFRIIKKKPIWNSIHLFYEARPGINVASIPNYGLIKGIFFQQGFGLKLKI